MQSRQTVFPIFAHLLRAESSSSQANILPPLSSFVILPHTDTCFEVQPSAVILPSNKWYSSMPFFFFNV